MTLPPEAILRFTTHVTALAPTPTPATPLALAISGGPDSMAMLALAAAAFPQAIIAATVDHRLRPASADEAAMVASYCNANQILHATLAPDRPPAGASIQAQARHLRYALLADWALAANAVALATAHHADDQAETFLMRAARGSGPAGLAGIRPRWDFRSDRWAASPTRTPAKAGVRPEAAAPALPIIRPLLTWRRADLRTLATDLPFVDDPSNADPRHDRTHARVLLATGRLDP
ncbi:tRNA lysidine(34) synthetase TilS, partial [Sphingomonas sp. Leaf10]|uniref:tRNA lysidine(34) synthetase TilS n=1 Tax=Sphingomonas sp. Leaf10 TaxID=1735676 RepID=UPI001F2F7E8A